MTTTTAKPLTIDDQLNYFEQKKGLHTQAMLRLNEIGQALTRCKKELQDTQAQSREEETSWRSRFRSLRGEITDAMRLEHTQRIARRELAQEFSALIEELELDQQQTMLDCCASGKEYVTAYNMAFVAYADNQWSAAMRSLSPTLIRAVKLKNMALSIQGAEQEGQPGYIAPEAAIKKLLGEKLIDAADSAVFDIKAEPVLEKIGLQRPALTGVDMTMYELGPAGKMKLHTELREKRQALSKGNK